MTDFEKIKKALEDGGNVEGRNFFVCEWEDRKSISLYKTYYVSFWETSELETEFNFDFDGNFTEII